MLYDIFIKIIKTVLIISFVTYNDSDYPVRANHSSNLLIKISLNQFLSI